MDGNDDDTRILIAQLHREKEYRPTGMFLLYDSARRFLLCQSARDEEYWGFPQGGIEENEDLVKNSSRELREELGIDACTELTSLLIGFHFERLAAPESRSDPCGYTLGKAYFASAARYVGDGHFTLQAEEIRGTVWVAQQDISQYCAGVRQEKQDVMQRALTKLRQSAAFDDVDRK